MEIKLYDRLQDYKESNSTTLKEIFDEAIKDFLGKKSTKVSESNK